MTDAVKKADAVEILSVGIVADDLTGAGDSAVQFARAGWRSQLILSEAFASKIEPGSAIAIVSDSRALNAEQANESTASAVAKLERSGVDRLYLKIDSTMRGSVIDQVRGGIAAWSKRCPNAFAVVCPAYPAAGRTVKNGRILVNGEGVEKTAVGSDPVTPVTTSDLAALLPGSLRIELSPNSVQNHVAQIETALKAGNRILIVDAETNADLQMIAAAITPFESDAVPVGSAGLAAAMAKAWAFQSPLTAIGSRRPLASHERILIVASSLHDVTQRQCTQLLNAFQKNEVCVFAPNLQDIIDPSSLQSWIEANLSTHPDLPRLILITAPSERLATEIAENVSTAIVSGLAAIASSVFDCGGIGSLTLLGGEGARAVLHRLGAESVTVIDAIREGIPLGKIQGGRVNGLTVITKAGGFGERDTLVDIVRELSS